MRNSLPWFPRCPHSITSKSRLNKETVFVQPVAWYKDIRDYELLVSLMWQECGKSEARVWQECGKLFHVEKSCSLYNKAMSHPIARAPFNTHLALDLKPCHFLYVPALEQEKHIRLILFEIFNQLCNRDCPQAGSCYFFFEELQFLKPDGDRV